MSETISPFEFSMFLAQEADPFALPGEAAPGGTGIQGQPGTPQAAREPLGGSSFLLFVFLAVAGLLVFSIFGQRRDKKKRESMLSNLKKHDKVQTVGGVIGSIVDVRKDLVVLKVDESSNTRITFARSAIQQILSGQTVPETPATSEKT